MAFDEEIAQLRKRVMDLERENEALKEEMGEIKRERISSTASDDRWQRRTEMEALERARDHARIDAGWNDD